MAINYNEEEFGLQIPTNEGGITDVAFKPGSALDRQINKLNELEQLGFPQPNLQNLKEMDMKQFQETGTPLSLPEDQYAMAISNYDEVFGPKTMTDANQSLYTGMMDQSGFPVNHIDRIRQPNLPGFAYEPKESFMDSFIEQYGNPELYQGLVERGEPLAVEPKQNLLEQLIQNSLAANLLKGVGSFAGDFFKGLVPYEYGTSQRYHQNLSPQGQAFANQLYRPGGSLQGYNQISAFGGGPSASLGKRADRIDKTLSNLDKNWSKLKGVNLKDGVDDFDRKRQRLEAKRDRFRSEQNTLNTAGWNQGAKAKTQGTIQQLNPNEMRNVAETGDAGGNTGAKIVCTMMNERYGFGSFRNKIWMKFHENHGPEYQKGYHTIFLPLVKIAKGEGKLNTAVRKVLEHMGRHVTADMFKIMKGKKRDTLGRIYRAIFEPTCRIIGKIKSALGRG